MAREKSEAEEGLKGGREDVGREEQAFVRQTGEFGRQTGEGKKDEESVRQKDDSIWQLDGGKKPNIQNIFN